jgi:hypothetical protein
VIVTAPVRGIGVLLLVASPAFASREFVVVWERDEFRVNAMASRPHERPVEAAAPAGDFVVAWVHQSYGLPAERPDVMSSPPVPQSAAEPVFVTPPLRLAADQP